MHEVLVNRLGGLSLPRKSGVRLTDHPDMTLDVYLRCGHKTTTQLQQQQQFSVCAGVVRAYIHLSTFVQAITSTFMYGFQNNMA